MQEIAVALPAFPHPPGARQRPEHLWGWMHPLQRRTLLAHRLARPFTHLPEIPQIVLAVLVHLGLVLTTAAVAAREHPDHRHHHHERHHEEDRVRRTVGTSEHEGDHAEHGHDHDHRHELHQDVSGSTPGNLRRRLKMHLTARWFGRRHSWCPLELERAHRKSPLQHYGTADTMHSRTHGSERHHIRGTGHRCGS